MVSIHPMLKLIIFLAYFRLCLSSFNTSHVKVNLTLRQQESVLVIVSIHPMLKLIITGIFKLDMNTGFNTSHVKVNPI